MWLYQKNNTVDSHTSKHQLSECFLFKCVIALQIFKVGKSDCASRSQPESIQHFLFLVSVFLFGERDLYCRARVFTKEKIVHHRCTRNTFRKIGFCLRSLSRKTKWSKILLKIDYASMKILICQANKLMWY